MWYSIWNHIYDVLYDIIVCNTISWSKLWYHMLTYHIIGYRLFRCRASAQPGTRPAGGAGCPGPGGRRRRQQRRSVNMIVLSRRPGSSDWVLNRGRPRAVTVTVTAGDGRLSTVSVAGIKSPRLTVPVSPRAARGGAAPRWHRRLNLWPGPSLSSRDWHSLAGQAQCHTGKSSVP